MKRLCAHCGNEFEGRADARYCSDTHRIAAHRAKPHEGPAGDKEDPAHLYAEAKRLFKLQQDHRGTQVITGLDGKPTTVLGPYQPTPETEARAREILRLRRKAARVEHPLTRP